MQYKDKELCDYCFEPLTEEGVCPLCGLTDETYQSEVGLLPPGTNLIGKYIIGRALGRGGFGATYLAFSGERNERVAIKEYFPISIAYRGKNEETVHLISGEHHALYEKGAKNFFEEAKTISCFNSQDGIVSVYEFFYSNNTAYYSMEYLDGTDLKRYINNRGGYLPENEVVHIANGICNALLYLHNERILHRDISPTNIFMCTNGDIKLIDFGAAKQLLAYEHQSFSVVVKQGFAPAEQYTRNGHQGTWTDIYALGATMYYALFGRVPPDAIDRADNPKLDFSSANPVSKKMCAIIAKCMHPQKESRYQNLHELLLDLNYIPEMKKKSDNALVGAFKRKNAIEYIGSAVAADSKVRNKTLLLNKKTSWAIITTGILLCVALVIAVCFYFVRQPEKKVVLDDQAYIEEAVANFQQKEAANKKAAQQEQKKEKNPSFWDRIFNPDDDKRENDKSSGSETKKSNNNNKNKATETKTETKKEDTKTEPKGTKNTGTNSDTTLPSSVGGATATKKEATKQEPVKQEPAKQEPAKQEPDEVRGDRQNQEPVKQEPPKQEPMKQEPVKQEPVNQEPSKQEAPEQVPVLDLRDDREPR